ncbi:hypothetical protein M408DRAFT_27709 [Serendipita vermifera MAFF 305830]|uniref:CHAT domain-containing protein n=1 Tax=Serendipita vermifera MAFF 305830 TaxID=933852 RepID=A0A0C3AUD5_SERVB|nr:hypothetical protein M408DRAFT_27709 [Serendipita vermifera MAFF 305830]
MSHNLPQSFRQFIKPIEAMGAFLTSIGGEDSEDDDLVCDKCEHEKKSKHHRRSSRQSGSGSGSKNDKVSALRDSVRLHKSHGSEVNNALRHAKLGRALHGRFELHGDPQDLDEAIAQLGTAMAILPAKHKHRNMYESNVGLLLCVRYEHTHAEKDLERANKYCRNSLTALEQTSDPNKEGAEMDKAWYRANLATALLHRYERHKAASDLEESLTLWKSAIASLPEGHPDKASYQSNLSAIYLARFQTTSNMDDLDRSINAIRSAIRGTPQDDMHWIVYKYMASSLYLKRYQKTQKVEDIDRAIEAGRAALTALPSKHRYASKYQAELATKLLSRFDLTADLADVNEAIDLSKDATVTFAYSAYPAERSTTPARRLVALSQALAKRFEKTDDMADLNDAIKHARQAATVADKSRSPERHLAHSSLSELIYMRFERLSNADDLDDSITHSTIAVDATPGSKSQKDREQLAEKLSTLSSHHLTRFEFQRGTGDLDAAVNYARTALDLKKAGDGDGPLSLLAHPAARYALALALFRRFEQGADMKDLEGALKNAQLAYDAVNKPVPTPSIASSRRLSISTSQTVTPSPEPDPRKILYQSLLSGVLCARYKRLGNREDIEAAIGHAEAILRATPPDHPLYEMYKSIHSYALRASPPQKQEPLSIEIPGDLISQVREQVETAKLAKDPKWGIHVLRLCNLMYARYEQKMDAREANGASESNKLAEDLDLEHALGDWRKVATSSLRTIPSPPSVRFRAALKWADVSCREGRYKSAVEAYKVAMSLAPRVSLARSRGALDEPSGASMEEGEENELLLNTFSLASDAAAAAIERGQLETAVEFIEQGRSLLWRDALGMPSEMDDLEKVNPELAQHLLEVLVELEQAVNGAGPLVSPVSPLIKSAMRPPWMSSGGDKMRNEGVDDKWKSIVGTVRASEAGFHNFLRPWTLDSMREEDAILPVGPVVLLNSSYLRCDAIILVSTSEPVLVPLTDVSKTDLEQLAARVVTGTRELGDGEATGFQFDKAVLEPVLKALWEKVVGPVIRKLEDVASGGGRNVGWVTTGAFTWLPIHAATLMGDNPHDKESAEDDGTIHSRVEYWSKYSNYYATTLQSLLRSPPHKATQSPSRVLVVSDQPSRRASLLGGIVTSTQALKSQLSPKHGDGESPEPRKIRIDSLEGPSAIPSAILDALHPHIAGDDDEEDIPSHSGADAIHFSCPTFCDALRPSSSSWRVAEGGVVRVNDLLNTWFFPQAFDGPTAPPEFVFSSTTSYRLEGPTRASGGEGRIRLPQELMSPEAALQFAGVRGVIGQLWNTKSEDATVVANHVYGTVVSTGLGEDRRIHVHPITGKILKADSKPGSRAPNASTAVWKTGGLEEGLSALRSAKVPLFRTVPFVRYGP